MGFPRAPRKRVSGTLSLYISPPVSSDAGKDEESAAQTEDLSSQLELAVPRGFIMDNDISKIVERQEKGALKRLTELREKARGCCHSKVDSVVVDRAQEIVERACAILRDVAHNPPSLVLGQQQDTSITIDLTVQTRHLALIIYRSRIAAGRYVNNALTEETEVRRLSPPIMEALSWVAEG